MRDVYINTLAELKTLSPVLYPCTEPSKTTEYGKNTYTLFNSIEDNFTIGWRVWRIAQATVAVVVGIFPGCCILFVIPRYRDWITECWNEGYSGIDKISIYVLPIVLEEFNKKAEPEAEKPKEEILLPDSIIPEPSRQALTESKRTDTPEEKDPKEEVLVTDSKKPELGRQTPKKNKYTDSPMKGSYVGSDHQKSRFSQRNVLSRNITEMPTRPKTNNNQVPVVKSRETLSKLYEDFAFNPPEGCTEEVKDKLKEIWANICKRKNFNVEAVEQILELNLLEPSALTELDDYSLAL